MASNIQKRKPLSKRTRFEVFKRDCFRCQYCGAEPPSAVLEIDHITPVSGGGDNSRDNLLTACFDCNRGKAAESLSVAPASVAEKAAILAEKRAQVLAFERLKKRQQKDQDKAIDALEDVLREFFPRRHFTVAARESVRRFLESMLPSDVESAFRKSFGKIRDPHQAMRYFYGICWNIIKDKGFKDA